MERSIALFAMGCFWCAEAAFAEKVESIRVGYAGGKSTVTPTYQNHEGYTEAVELTFDPEKITYHALLNLFWENIDPFDKNGQFCDRGPSYAAVIYTTNEQQKKEVEAFLKDMKQKFSEQEIAVRILPATTFYPAEEYHQNYKTKNPSHYKLYKINSGRDQKHKN